MANSNDPRPFTDKAREARRAASRALFIDRKEVFRRVRPARTGMQRLHLGLASGALLSEERARAGSHELWLISAPNFLPDALSRTSEGFEIGLAQLPQLPLVTSNKRHKTRQLLEQYARAAGVALNIASELESHSQSLEMVLRASAYTIVPKAAILPQLKRGELVAIRFRERVQRRCYLLRKSGRVVTAASLAVEETAIAILQEMNARYALDLTF
jgi:hypothetical protein